MGRSVDELMGERLNVKEIRTKKKEQRKNERIKIKKNKDRTKNQKRVTRDR